MTHRDIEDIVVPPPRAPPVSPYTSIHIEYDVAIIGSGAVGCAIARELSKYKLKILVIEKSDDCGQGASKANSGIVHGGYDERHGTVKASLSRRGNQLFAHLNKDLHFGFRVTGSLVLAFTKEDVKVLEDLMVNGRLNGVDDIRLIDKEEIKTIEPNISPNVISALYCPSAGITSPYEFTIALAENAVQNGVEFRFSHEVMDIQRLYSNEENDKFGIRGGYFLRTTSEGNPISANIVINCAGLYADKVAAMVGANNFAINPRKGEYIILDRSQGEKVKTVLFPVPSKTKGKGVLVSQTYHGTLLLGPTSRGVEDGASASLSNAQVTQQIINAAQVILPTIDTSKIITGYSGMRSKSDRQDFIIEESNSCHGFINVAGIDSPGLTASPAVAELVVHILRDKCKLKLIANPNFYPRRPAIFIPKDQNFDGKVDSAIPEKNIVCRCEKVTEAEIVDAIHRVIPALTTDAVKKRTRAGMGYCQGQFCEQRVAWLISREKNIPFNSVGRHTVGSSVLPHRKLTDEDKEFIQCLSSTALIPSNNNNNNSNININKL